MNCPSVGPFPRGAVLQEQAAPAWVPDRVTSPPSKPALAWAPLSTDPQVLAGACSSTGSPRGHNLLRASTCCGVESLPQATGGDLLHRGPPWAAGDSLPHYGLHHGLYGENLCSSILSTSLPSFFTDLGVCRVVSLTQSQLLSLHCCFPAGFFSPFLICYSTGTTTVTDGLGLGQWWVCLGAG